MGGKEDFPANSICGYTICIFLVTMFLLASASKIHTNNNHSSMPDKVRVSHGVIQWPANPKIVIWTCFVRFLVQLETL